MQKTLSSYASSYNLGHKHLDRLWDGTVYVQEKVDGSQISFGVDEAGNIFARSRRKELYLGEGGMFQKGLETIERIAGRLTPGLTYRGEYLQRPKHNVITYGRVPRGHIILYDVERGEGDFMPPSLLLAEAEMVGLEATPLVIILESKPPQSFLDSLLDCESVLGGGRIEGLAFKNYSQFGPDKKILFGKLVWEEFKERHSKEWKDQNPSRKDVVERIIDQYRTEARWQKAIQHLAEQGELVNAPQDIGPLLKEIGQDLLADAEDEIKEILFKHFWKQIARGATRGFPEWYKGHLQTPNGGEA